MSKKELQRADVLARVRAGGTGWYRPPPNLEPIFEADFDSNAFGYRPKRSAQDAIRKVRRLLCRGYTEVVDSDLSKYFDSILHGELMECVARRIVDREVLRLMKTWLRFRSRKRVSKGTGP